MGTIPLGLSAYDRAELPPVTLVNYFYEKAPTNLEDQVAIIPRARLKDFAMAGLGPMRGLYRKGGVLANVGLSGSILAMSGADLYRVTQTGLPGVGTATFIGSVEGPTKMSAEGTPDWIVLCAGTKLYKTNGTTLTEIAMPAGFSAYSVDYLDGRFLVSSDIGRFYWTEVGGVTIDALNYATAESQPDTLQCLKVIGDELWLIGRLSIEVWQPTADPDLPYQRINGRIFGIGVTGRESVQKMNVDGLDAICWVGTDRRVYRTDPNPTKISNYDMDARLDRVVDPTTLYATTWPWHGHQFYVLHIPGEGSWAYDLSTGQWDEVTSYDQPLFRTTVSAIGPNNQPLLGDIAQGKIWEMSETVRTDGDDPVVYKFSGLLEVTSAPTRCNSVSLDLAAGLTPDPENDPMMNLSWSDDLGATYSDAVASSIGRQGDRLASVRWSRLGKLRRPGRVFEWTTTEPVTVRKAKYNEVSK